jgi:hypothetical protein
LILHSHLWHRTSVDPCSRTNEKDMHGKKHWKEKHDESVHDVIPQP